MVFLSLPTLGKGHHGVYGLEQCRVGGGGLSEVLHINPLLLSGCTFVIYYTLAFYRSVISKLCVAACCSLVYSFLYLQLLIEHGCR